MVEKLKKRRIGKKKIPLSSTNQKTAFWYKVELKQKVMTEIYSGTLTCMYTVLWLKMPFVDINTQIFGSIMQPVKSTWTFSRHNVQSITTKKLLVLWKSEIEGNVWITKWTLLTSFNKKKLNNWCTTHCLTLTWNST
jgi:hypothetical protein